MIIVIVSVVLTLVALLLFGVASGTLWWQLHAWHTPEAFEAAGYPAVATPQHSFSIIMPCREEPEHVMRATLDRLLAQTHPDVQIIISVGDDDADTVAIAHALAARNPAQVFVSINHDPVKNKPRQLNTALRMCTKDIVGIIDAESIAHPELLAHVDTTFVVRKADVVQGSVHLVNFRATWFSLRNCMEYRSWFRSRLHGHADSGFIPLGGNTVFIHRALVEEVGGWDGDCLAEDCDMGVRLSTLGKRVVCAYDAELTTQEEAPEKVSQLIKQRTRWALGFMQVLAKGDWKRLPTRGQRMAAWWTLTQQHFMALMGLLLPVAIVTALFVNLPIWVALITFLPLVPTSAMVAFEVLILHEFGRDMGFDLRLRDYVVLIVSTPFYQVLLAVSALRAAWKYATSDFAWEKTMHSGSHLATEALLPETAGR